LKAQIGNYTMSAVDLPTSDTKIYEDLTTNPQTGHITLTFTVDSSCDEPFFLYDFEITTAGGTASYFTRLNKLMRPAIISSSTRPARVG
jgi:endoglucanase Acf2